MADWRPSLFGKLAVCTSLTTYISEMTLPIYLKTSIQITSDPQVIPLFQKIRSDSKWPIGGHFSCEKIALKAKYPTVIT